VTAGRSRWFLALSAVGAVILQSGCALAADDVPKCGVAGISSPAPANAHALSEQDYPLLSALLGEHGATYLEFVIKEDGSVISPVVFRSSGSMRLDDAATTLVVQHWRYLPAVLNGKPVACKWRAEVVWQLNQSAFNMPQGGPANVVFMTPADYPKDALARGEQGATALVVVYATDAAPEVRVIRSSGFLDLDVESMKLAFAKLHAKAGEYGGTQVKTVIFLVMVWALQPPAPPPQ
jgi:TonB family protein